MGHRVSTPRQADAMRYGIVTSLTILLAVASTATAATSHSCGCFVSHPTNALPTSISSCSGVLEAYSSSVAAATVPPPNSRLGRLRQQCQASSLSRQPPGTKRSQRSVRSTVGNKAKNGGIRRTDLRYTSSYGSHYAQCSSDDTSSISDADDESLWRGLASSRASAIEEDELMFSANQRTSKKYGNSTQDTRPCIPSKCVSATSKKGKRARMLRFLDKRFARLQLNKQSRQGAPSAFRSIDSTMSSDEKRRLDYEQRKAAWAAKYTSVTALRNSFGTNKNRIIGDFDPPTTRKLYHTLLPRALLELRGLRDGLLANSEEDKKTVQHSRPESAQVAEDDTNVDAYLQQELKSLAPLAYEARLAAKKYARERSRLPGRIGSMLYDGFRSWKRYGKWKSTGMTWEQVWSKYEDQVLREVMEELDELGEALDVNANEDGTTTNGLDAKAIFDSPIRRGDNLDDEELTARICLRILERSVVTNGAIDKLFLSQLAEDEKEEEDIEEDSARKRRRQRQRKERLRKRRQRIQADLQAIEQKFDKDIRELIRYSNWTTREGEERRSKRGRRGAFFWTKKDENGVESAVRSEASSAAGTPPDMSTPASEMMAETSDELASAMLSMPQVSSESPSDAVTADDTSKDSIEDSSLRKLAVHEVIALRILATTKQRITSLQDLPQLGGGGQDKSPKNDDDD